MTSPCRTTRRPPKGPTPTTGPTWRRSAAGTARAAPDGRSQTLALYLKALETQRSRSPTGPRGRDHRTLAVDATPATRRERVATGRGPRRRGPKRSSYRLHGNIERPNVAGRRSSFPFRASRPRPRLLRSRSGGQLARLDVCGIGAPKQHASPSRRRGRRSGSRPQRHRDGGAPATQPLSGGLVVRPVGLSLPTLRRRLATIASRHALALRRRRSTHLSAPVAIIASCVSRRQFFRRALAAPKRFRSPRGRCVGASRVTRRRADPPGRRDEPALLS